MSDLRCTAEGDWGRCERPIHSEVKRLCYGHIRQVRDRGEVYRKVEPRGPKPREGCGFPGCGRPHSSKGYCSGHYNQIRKGYPLRELRDRNPPGTICSAQGADWACAEPANPYSERCQFHIEQFSRLGFVQPRVQRPTKEVLFRDDQGLKKCNACSKWKKDEEYYEASHTSDFRQPDCIECYLWRNTLRNFKMTRLEYEALLDSQGGTCATCGRAPVDKRLGVDHDHSCCDAAGKSCGKCIRGLLCSSCNTALGLIRDDTETLKRMVGYLEDWRRND